MRTRDGQVRSWTTVVVAAVALALLGGTVAILALPGDRADSVDTATGEPTVAVAVRDFNDARTVHAVPTLSSPTTLTVSDAGRVTSTTCEVGTTIGSGSSPLTIDERPVIALATTIPLWRDLGVGARGDDVVALQTELRRLGHDVRPDGIFGSGTAAAVRALLRDLGDTSKSSTLRSASVMWLPTPSITVSSCEVLLADRFAGGAVAKVGGGLVALTIAAGGEDVDGTEGAVPGPRVLTYNDGAAEVDEKGRVTDPAFLAAVAAGPGFAMAKENGGAITMQYVLASSVEVAVVPPGSIYALSGGSGCVVGDGAPLAVTVVSSALGQALVSFDGDAVPTQVHVAPGDGPACR